MQLGMIGLGRMGADMVRRLMRGGHDCVVYDRNPAAVAELVGNGAAGSASLTEFVAQLPSPRLVWLMVPAAAVEATIADVVPLLDAGDILIDGGNSHYHDDIRRSSELQGRGISYLDVGTSGGVWGLERGYCLMIGGERDAVEKLEPAYAEGFNILRHANAGKEGREADAETTPLRHPEQYRYDFDLPEIAELWRRGSVVASWLLD